MKCLLSCILFVEILLFLPCSAAQPVGSMQHAAHGPTAALLLPVAARPEALAFAAPAAPHSPQRAQAPAAPRLAPAAEAETTRLASAARAAHRQLQAAYQQQRQVLLQTQTRLRTAEQSRAQAWLAVAGLAAGLLLTLALSWWARRQLRQRAAREAQLRTRLATDLQAEVGTLLTRVSQQADQLSQRQPAPNPALDRLLGSSQAAAHTVRDLAWGIDAQADNTVGALLERMRGHLAQTAGTAGLQTELQADGLYSALRLPAELRQYLYLIFKEAVANVLQHAARPTKIVVTLTHYSVANALMLGIEDDGQPTPSPARDGTGLPLMHERARALQGRLEVGRQPRGGFRVWLQVPF